MRLVLTIYGLSPMHSATPPKCSIIVGQKFNLFIQSEKFTIQLLNHSTDTRQILVLTDSGFSGGQVGGKNGQDRSFFHMSTALF